MKKEIAAFIMAGLLVSGGYGAAAQNEMEQAAGVQHGMGYISISDAAKPEIGSYNAWGDGPGPVSYTHLTLPTTERV